ncbi:MAG TPA: MarR family transcriptional regulator [Candidatus Lachnoclostridium stercorigallinarum]|uniref:MarR family transcriptional regulator n=1 Tax=Candidatus Lachnoclostridium stercorigallinarum TaxID=2838634 RepID=A0A9D2GII5_9FIRM|nr:MarR family transcriptional regulator [Candidatus Lachnoclostridium stercorigallinarum]
MRQSGKTPKTLADFRKATMELDYVYSGFPKGCGLSEAEYWSLLFIYEGAATQSQISSQLFISRQTLNSAFKQLRKKGLVRLEAYEENQRSKQAFLTEEGEEFVEKYVLRMHRTEERAWQQMSSEEQEALTKLIRKFSDLVRKELEVSKTNATQGSSEGSRPQP